MTSEYEKYREVAVEARKKALKILKETDGWNSVSTNVGEEVTLDWREGDVAGMNRDDGAEGGAAGWKCWRLSAVMEAEMETVVSVLMDYDNSCKWNPALAKTKIVVKPDEEFMITYQVTSGQRPVVSQRDFAFLVSVAREGQSWLGGGCSAHLHEHPINSTYVRAWQYPTIMEVKPVEGNPNQSYFTWMLQCDFGGMMPVSLLNLAMPYCIKLFTSSLRKRVKKVQSEKQKL